ncbi:MAG: NAD-dependent succinate-semialdehyde dehydrogenase, partial [Citromicrobium sp.]|nr:NAD-dependent succinate-semialdehyde dehydrogenase [Citromicrobium sp.]
MSDHSSLHLLIGGEKLSGGSRETQDVIDPATAEVLGSLPHATSDDLDTALANADKGFHAWRKESADKRAAVLTKAGQLLRERAKDIGTLLTKEQGKPVKEAIGEVIYCAMLFEFYAGECKRTYGRELV